MPLTLFPIALSHLSTKLRYLASAVKVLRYPQYSAPDANSFDESGDAELSTTEGAAFKCWRRSLVKSATSSLLLSPSSEGVGNQVVAGDWIEGVADGVGGSVGGALATLSATVFLVTECEAFRASREILLGAF